MTQVVPPGCVVVAADGSAHAERALRWAAHQALLQRRSLAVLTAGEDVESTNDDAARQARGIVGDDVEVLALTTSGDPRTALVEASRLAHVVVVGSRGRGAIRSALLGSVSAAVSKHATCPVVVCRPQETAGGHGVLVGVDATPLSQPVLDFAFAFASHNAMALTAVHCVWDVVAAVEGHQGVSTGSTSPIPADDETSAALATATAGFRERYPDVPLTLQVAHGLADEVLGSRSAAAWDLVVVGRHPLDTLSRLVTGSIATSVVERARTTVAVVPVPPETGVL
ncbi:universal stress protein [Nocardioides sp. zg-536]|uniref:Universal stress protein n=1 Tax=Nocardioides faecalis TaxID=2803858 RepID=A0A939BXC0_9ACTN|nr:universal stress protein [Nocardioides faecalis]MBM9461562.1 universal stress protein [Nocardioides faecalis]MBS4752528.1 universal stress protein [Nocardioides faecalis]QVI57804.1 universal stress protein [Nocardioides faecalis]